MNHAVVVGGGFWGVAAALSLEARGWGVTLVDAANSHGGSVNSSGYYKASWFRKMPLAARSRALAAEFGVRFESRSCWAFDRRGVRAEPGWETFEPAQFLALRRRDLHASVRRIVRHGSAWVVEAHAAPDAFPRLGGPIECDAVVLAAGAWTDEVLVRSALDPLGITGLAGEGLLLDGPEIRDLVHQRVNPFKGYTLRDWSDGLATARVGETTEKAAGEHLRKLQDVMAPHIMGRRVVGHMRGLRPIAPRGPSAYPVAPGLVAISGGGKIGGALAFGVAETAVSHLEAR